MKTNEKLPPLAFIALESHEIASPLSLVDVCGAPESLIQTTVEPALMVTLAGSNANEPPALVILTVVAFAGIAVVAVGAGAVVAVGALVAPPEVVAAVAPQPASIISAPTESSSAPRDASRCTHLLVRIVESLPLFD